MNDSGDIHTVPPPYQRCVTRSCQRGRRQLQSSGVALRGTGFQVGEDPPLATEIGWSGNHGAQATHRADSGSTPRTRSVLDLPGSIGAMLGLTNPAAAEVGGATRELMRAIEPADLLAAYPVLDDLVAQIKVHRTQL